MRQNLPIILGALVIFAVVSGVIVFNDSVTEGEFT